MSDWQFLQKQLLHVEMLNDQQSLSLADFDDTEALARVASVILYRGYQYVIPA